MDHLAKIDKFFKKYPLRKIKKDKIIIDPFEPPSGIYYINEGYVRQYNISQDGKELTLHIHTPGSHFPMFYAFDLFENRYYFQSMTNISVNIVPKKDVVDFLQTNPNNAIHFIKKMLMGIEGLTKRLEINAFGNAKTRVISALIYLNKHFGKTESEISIINATFTHERLATITGLTREHVSIELEKLVKEKLITYKNHKIVILDYERLSSLLPF